MFIFVKFDSKRFKTTWTIIPLLLILALMPYRVAKVYNGVNYYPDPSDHSLRNSIYAFSNAILNLGKAKKNANNYQDYQVIDLKQDLTNVNIILIVGESINDQHMSLLGYKRDTSPLLSQLKSDPNFIYKHGLSSGISTLSSLPLFFNSAYEPNNSKPMDLQNANLFKLAKQHQFKTFFVSAQSGTMLSNLGMEFADYKIFYNKEKTLFDKYGDEALLKIIDKLDYAKSNFIVINQRNAHAPYEGNYAHNARFNHFSVDRNNFKQFLIDTYDNAMLYNDYILFEMINFYHHKFTGPTYIFFVSDHGEVVDPDKGVYGHSVLSEEVAKIPFLAYIQNDKAGYIEKINQIKEPICHYELNQIIISILGYNLINPNFKPGICYIHGTEFDGNNEFIEYNKNR